MDEHNIPGMIDVTTEIGKPGRKGEQFISFSVQSVSGIADNVECDKFRGLRSGDMTSIHICYRTQHSIAFVGLLIFMGAHGFLIIVWLIIWHFTIT